jgi:hypothetical protein
MLLKKLKVKLQKFIVYQYGIQIIYILFFVLFLGLLLKTNISYFKPRFNYYGQKKV